MSRYTLLWGAALAGLALHLAGLGWDAYLHARDSTLAERESIFTLGNPAHALMIVGMTGMAAAVVAVAVFWLNEHHFAGQGRVARLGRLAALPVAALILAAAVSLMALRADQAHEHHDSKQVAAANGESPLAGGHSHSGTAGGSPLAAAIEGQGDPHIHGAEVNVTAEQLAAAADFYAGVKASTAKYEDVRAALADGYVQITQDLPGIAAHLTNFTHNSDGVLMDPTRIETLLYSKRVDGEWRLVGAMFTSEKPAETPPTFFGGLDAWHFHENLCFQLARVTVAASKSDCVGVFLPRTPWMLHVWTMPGATGVFAHDFAPISPGAFPPATQPAARDLALQAR